MLMKSCLLPQRLSRVEPGDECRPLLCNWSADEVDRISDATPAIATLAQYRARAELQALRDVLATHGDNLTVAARTLGISRPTFYRLLHKHQIQR
jgi:transcriptional regulator of acetoin/glycerol metabolism